MSFQSVVVIGTSAGGVEALRGLLAQLPADFAASVFITMHLAPDHPSHLKEILQRVTALPVLRGVDGDPIKAGHIYVAQPNHHLLLERGRVRISLGPQENRFRPAVDVLFRSAAWNYGAQVTGVVLTGALDDGSAGLVAIKERGGIAVVQDPRDAFMSSMPENALRNAPVDHVVPLCDMGPLLVRLTREAAVRGNMEKEAPVSDEIKRMETEVAVALGDNGRMREIMNMGELTPYTCPECHGVLVKLKEGRMTRFRCHTGHAFTLNHLLSEVTQYNEEILMNALRALEETELLLSHTRRHYEDNKEPDMAEVVRQKQEQVRRQAAVVKEAAMVNEVMSLDMLENGSDQGVGRATG